MRWASELIVVVSEVGCLVVSTFTASWMRWAIAAAAEVFLFVSVRMLWVRWIIMGVAGFLVVVGTATSCTRCTGLLSGIPSLSSSTLEYWKSRALGSVGVASSSSDRAVRRAGNCCDSPVGT